MSGRLFFSPVSEASPFLQGPFGDHGRRGSGSPALGYKIPVYTTEYPNPAPFGGEEDCKEQFFKYLDKEITRLMRYQKDKAAIDRQKQQVERLRRHVPDGPRLEGLLRYEAHLDRGIERDLVQLERAQQMRFAREAEAKD